MITLNTLYFHIIFFVCDNIYFSAVTCGILESSTHQSKTLCTCAEPEYNTSKINLTNKTLFQLKILMFDCYTKFGWNVNFFRLFVQTNIFMLRLNNFRFKCASDEESGVFRRVVGQHGSSDRTHGHPIWQSHNQRRQWVRRLSQKASSLKYM